MTDQSKSWRDAKIPQWVKESVEAEIKQAKLRAALSWPTEAKPKPLSFRWGEYDRLHGDPEPGRYWGVFSSGRIECFELARAIETGGDVHHWKVWAFKREGCNKWTSNPVRGPIFASEREARVYSFWIKCEDAAERLLEARKGIE